MPDLVLRLCGPMQSYSAWGRGGKRPTLPFPTKSAIVGMAMNALGYRFNENNEIWNPCDVPELKDIVFGKTDVLVLREGIVEHDYQTGGGIYGSYGSGTRENDYDPIRSRAIFTIVNGEKKGIGGYTKPLERRKMSLFLYDKNGRPKKEKNEERYNYGFPNVKYTKNIPDCKFRNQKGLVVIQERGILQDYDFLVIQKISACNVEQIRAAFSNPRLQVSLGRRSFKPSCTVFQCVCEEKSMKHYIEEHKVSKSLVSYEEDTDGEIIVMDVPLNLKPTNRRYSNRRIKMMVNHV